MIVGVRKNVPFVVKAVPESKIEGKWLSGQIIETIQSLHEIGFHVRAVISDNHPSNVSAFNELFSKYGSESHENVILHHSTSGWRTYLFYDSVHLLKNVRNNLLNSRQFIFPEFHFSDFISLPAGKISWKLLHSVFDEDEKLQANLRKAYKLPYKVLHPGDNKQSVPLALAIFDPTTSAAIESYFPESNAAAQFLRLINLWWTISNSKQQFNMNFHRGDAAKANDCKPTFLQKLADWFSEWKTQQPANTEKFTLSKQTTSALVTTLRCTATLIEDLLQEGYAYVLTARFQTDPLERQFSKYRQMSGGWFLVGLREATNNERILALKSLLKESISFWQENIRPDSSKDVALLYFNQNLKNISSEIESCCLDQNSTEVAAVVSGYFAKKMIKRTSCLDCRSCLIYNTENQSASECFEYLSTLSRGALTQPATDLTHYVSKSFAMLELCEYIIRQSDLHERVAAENALKFNDLPQSFLCDNHLENIKFINRTICNVFFNNTQKLVNSQVRREVVQQFKERQRKRRHTWLE